jgi:protein-S-isoprenylcysteine O-methyltransferase Ste14
MTGQCFCGSVAFEFEGPTTSIELCHCSRCQRATGSPFAAEFRVRVEKFRWLRGEELISFCDAPILRESPPYRRSFCKTCGSQVPSVFAGDPGVAIPTGLVEGDLPARVLDHIWVSKKANWLNLRELGTLPEYDGDRLRRNGPNASPKLARTRHAPTALLSWAQIYAMLFGDEDCDTGIDDFRALGHLGGVVYRRGALVQPHRKKSRHRGRALFPRSLLRRAILMFGFPPTRHYYAQVQLWHLGDAPNWILGALTVAGLLFAWWARIHLGRLWSDWVVKKAGHHIVDTGPYSLVRHPIYSAIILAAFATAIEKGTSFALLGCATITLAFYTKARREERFLRAELGEDAYHAYARETAMLVPFVRI